MKQQTLQELLTPPSELLDMIIYLTDYLGKNSTESRDVDGVKRIYSETLTVYNVISLRLNNSLRFTEPEEIVKEFLVLSHRIYNRLDQGNLKINKSLDADILKLNYALFVFFSTMQFEMNQKAFKESIQVDNGEYLILLQTIYGAVTRQCHFQTLLSEKEFIQLAYQYFSAKTDPTDFFRRRDEWGY